MLRSEMDPPTGLAPVSRRYHDARRFLRFGGMKWSGTSVLPRVSRRSERRGLLSSSCPMDTHPGLAPGNAVLQTAGSSALPCARFIEWGSRRVLPPLGDLHRIECWLLHHGLHLKAILRPALPRHGLLYERSALLTSATEELESGAPARTCTSNLRLRRAACSSLTPRELKWCAMPVLPRRPRFGRPPCLLYTNDAKSGGCCRYRAGLSSSSGRR